MKSTLKYFWLTIKHKWFVFLAGLKIKAKLWDLIMHDLSKFRWSELPHYGRQFCGEANDPEGFALCWLNHQNRNKHHWEYWISRSGRMYKNKPAEMPERYIREMIADWTGAARAYEGDWPSARRDWPWYEKSIGKIVLHPVTAQKIDKIIYEELGFKTGNFWRGHCDALQDDCENSPFGSAGGIEARKTGLVAPSYIGIDDATEWLAGYVNFCEKRYGHDWKTCEFNWCPALTI